LFNFGYTIDVSIQLKQIVFTIILFNIHEYFCLAIYMPKSCMTWHDGFFSGYNGFPTNKTGNKSQKLSTEKKQKLGLHT
jgi:hypothetical protein